MATDTVTSGLVLTEPAGVTPCQQLCNRLRDAAPPPADTLGMLTTAAKALPEW